MTEHIWTYGYFRYKIKVPHESSTKVSENFVNCIQLSIFNYGLHTQCVVSCKSNGINNVNQKPNKPQYRCNTNVVSVALEVDIYTYSTHKDIYLFFNIKQSSKESEKLESHF